MATATCISEYGRLAEVFASHPLTLELKRMFRTDVEWGNLVRHEISVSITVGPEVVTPPPSPVNPLFTNTNPTLRIGNLSTSSDRKKLLTTIQETFGGFGTIRNINLPMDRATGNPRGFAFIEYRDTHDAQSAYEALSGSLNLGGRDISVEYAASQQKSSKEMAIAYGPPKSYR